jgi:hypothetical protein
MRLRERAFTILVIGAIAVVVAWLVAVTGVTHEATSTEFCVVSLDQPEDSYPLAVTSGQPFEVLLGISNHEGQAVTYTVEAQLRGDVSQVLLSTDGEGAEVIDEHAFGITDLEDEAAWEHVVQVTALAPGIGQQLDFLLFSPLLRDGGFLQSYLIGCGGAVIDVHEERGEASVTLNAGDESFHSCRIEAWQGGRKVSELPMHVDVNEVRTFDFSYPAGETRFRLYDGNVLVMNDTGADQFVRFWVDVS